MKFLHTLKYASLKEVYPIFSAFNIINIFLIVTNIKLKSYRAFYDALLSLPC